MTPEEQNKPLSVYRLLPSMREFQLLCFDNSLVDVMRWQLGGSRGPHPTVFSAAWGGDTRWRKSDFPSGNPSSPALSRRLADRLGDDLRAGGRLLPVHIDAADTRPRGRDARGDEYFLYLVERAVDCLDQEKSSPPDQLGRIRTSVFRPDAVPTELPAFRPTQFPTAVCWNGWMVERLAEFLGDQLETRLVWSQDPKRTAHPDPWGF
ncbi:hypothetical protein [Streptomyces sp. NPDC046925]|uniref:hypothetical protein n=1 Tax=Streptomyces sp. NPDC046925 TaxID=3155375 RepID=UPI003411623C